MKLSTRLAGRPESSTLHDMNFRGSIVCLVLVLAWGIASGPVREGRAADEGGRFWSFQPVRAVGLPSVRGENRGQTPVDRFILASLEKRGLRPNPVADRRTLLRRATLDLTGLPPAPEDVDRFLEDESPEAFAKVVDRLLASPRYGERWGRHWLDVVRYADARDLIQLPAESDFREAWRYRDLVVGAFKRDLPYDQFLMQQVAGDLLQPADPDRIDADALVATGLLAIADFVPGDVDKEQMIADYVNDQIDVVGRAVLGLTLACARCHDHKFDPITTEDYYSLAGIFFSTRLVPGPIKGNTPLVRAPLLPPREIAELQNGQARDKARLAELSREISTLGEREYRTWLERRVDTETERFLLAAWELAHPPEGKARPAVADFAKAKGLDEVMLARWVAHFDEAQPHPALVAVRDASTREKAEQEVRDLARKLATYRAGRLPSASSDAAARSIGETPQFRFRADDRRIVANDARQVTLWPNRGRIPENATPVADVGAPSIATVLVRDHTRPVLHFTGKELLQAPGSIPATGSLFVVFRPDLAGVVGQRLIGWEDAAVGQHGLGIMTDAAGSVHAILRRNGANGDVVVPAPTPAPAASEFQIISITWGPNGVTVHRNGQVVGSNKSIDSVSSDPAIVALRIGGPGSGSSPRFQGDVAELRVYGMPLDDGTRSLIEGQLTARWNGVPGESPGIDPVHDLFEELVSAQSPFRLETAERDKSLTEEFRARLASLREEQTALQKKSPPDIPQAVVVRDGGPPGTSHEGFHDAKVFVRGNHLKPGKTVPRGFPRVIAGSDPPPIREGSGRRELARWLTSPGNPLTARVMVNRIWQHHFGAGLVRTSANFGAMGESPSHPELLDFLAARFVESGWSFKAVHRLIMLSNAYQQSSVPSAEGLAVDPENRFLWRANRRKLELEALRDSLFAVAGKLDSTPGGPGFLDLATPRRSLYLMSVRTGAKTSEFGPLFDAPDCSGIVERRTESIVAPQALFLMNNALVTELARGLASRVAREAPGGDDRARLGKLYEITLGRPPVEAELDVGLQFLALDAGTRQTAAGPPNRESSVSEGWIRYCQLILCTNEFMYVD
ncbi:MAG: DUF1553 domain-containing protein [Planctomycetia bacterium]|nr:DUF1553 domain-containing protein [Planctomycetia bacterium]